MEVAKYYVSQDKIKAKLWELDTKDDLMTETKETSMPESEKQIFIQFSPQSNVPAFVFGCKYYRIGNAYEATGDWHSEIAEFRGVIEELIK